MKASILIAGIALLPSLTHANEIPAIDEASNTMNMAALQNLSQQRRKIMTEPMLIPFSHYR